MGLKIAQFRYYGANNPNAKKYNFPVVTDIYADNYGASLFPYRWTFEKYKNIQSIHIQTIPGLKLYINQDKKSSANHEMLPFIIGPTGNFDIVLRDRILKTTQKYSNLLAVTGLTIDDNSKKTLDVLENGFLIITIIYKN